MARLYSNNAQSTLASSIISSDTSLTVATGQGSKFPLITSPDYFTVTLTQAGTTETSWEEVKVVAVNGDVFTIVRGQESTTPANWNAGDKVEIRWTANAAQDAANVASTGVTVLDFGATPGTNIITVTISGQTDIKSTSIVDAFLIISASADHNAYEHIIAPITIRCGNIIPGTSFDIIGYSEHRLTGRFNVQWIRTK